MREWNLKNGDPLTLTLASDARLGESDYCNDHIWELTLGGGEPPALVLQTNFGLRARTFRIFPRFSLGDYGLSDPNNYVRQPVIKRLFPNYVWLDFSPFPDIDVQASVWVPTPHSIASRYQLTNRSTVQISITVEILGQLSPTNGQRMAPMEIQASQVLAGQAEDLAPLIFVIGGSKFGAGSYPSLMNILDISPGESKILTWIQAACPTVDESIQHARQIAARRWDAEMARLEFLNLGQVEIYSGDQDWDTAFMLSQKCAYSLIQGPSDQLPYPSIVYNRTPEQGRSLRGDGTDYNYMWNGQSPFEVLYMCSFLLPGYPDLMQGLLKNFLATQAEDGSIDWKPGLAGQRSFIAATPILANIARRIFEVTQDQDFLADIFPGLVKFIQAWFKSVHDRDGDGVPEWDHQIQAGYEDHPVFSRWQPWSRGQDIETAESPALCALLYTEILTLLDFAVTLSHAEATASLREIAERLRLAVEISWDQDYAIYRDVDRDTHFCTHYELIGSDHGIDVSVIGREFTSPIRLLIHIITMDGGNRKARLIIHGTSATGLPRLEQLGEEKFRWHQGRGVFTGNRVYKYIEKIEFIGIEPEDQVLISAAGFNHTDLSLLLPLWAGIPDANRARSLIEHTITNPEKFWQPAGIPTYLPDLMPISVTSERTGADQPLIINMLLDSLIGEGLVKYGYRNLAAELVTRLMNSTIASLKNDHCFRHYYDAISGLGSGERDAIQGLAPLGLFLETLGVKILSAKKIILSGFNPFPWPITVKYRGLTILRLKDRSTVIFPDGQAMEIDDPTPLLVTLEPG